MELVSAYLEKVKKTEPSQLPDAISPRLTSRNETEFVAPNRGEQVLNVQRGPQVTPETPLASYHPDDTSMLQQGRNDVNQTAEIIFNSLSDSEKFSLKVLQALDDGLGNHGLEKTANAYIRQFETEYDRVVKDLADYFYNYKPRGVDIARVPSDSSSAVMGETYKRFSNNEPWYSDAFKRFGHKPTKQEALELAIEKINYDIRHGGGEWVSEEMADMAKTIDGISALANNPSFKDLGADTAKTFKSTEELIKEYGAIHRGEHVYVNSEDVTRDIKVPRATPSGDTARFARTMAESKVLDDKMVDEIIDGVKHGDFAGTRKTNKVAVDNANRVIKEQGLDSALEGYVTNSNLGKNATSGIISSPQLYKSKQNI